MSAADRANGYYEASMSVRDPVLRTLKRKNRGRCESDIDTHQRLAAIFETVFCSSAQKQQSGPGSAQMYT